MKTPTKQLRRLAAVALASALLGGVADAATACRALRYSFTSVCLRAPGDASCTWHADRPSLGPQIAVWVKAPTARASSAALMVTNATALYGIGNRPGLWNLRSGPKFPYGRRPWCCPCGRTRAARRTRSSSTRTDKRGCSRITRATRRQTRILLPDAARPGGRRHHLSERGVSRRQRPRLDATQTSVYPPRGDLFDLETICPVLVNRPEGSCNAGDSRQYAFLDDVDAISAATPPFGVATQGAWTVPDDLPAGDYALVVEVNKEFDTNAAYDATNAPSLDFDTFGTAGNLGQPSGRLPRAVHRRRGVGRPRAAARRP